MWGPKNPVILMHPMLFPSRPPEPWQRDPEQDRGAELLAGLLEHPSGREGLLPGDTAGGRGRCSDKEHLRRWRQQLCHLPRAEPREAILCPGDGSGWPLPGISPQHSSLDT